MNSPDTTGALTGERLLAEQCIPCSALRPSLFQFIQKQHPQLTEADSISTDELATFKADYVEDALSEELGEITDLERDVIESLREHELVSASPADRADDASRTLGERLADRIAEFGGSWGFILSFVAFLALWLVGNTLVLTTHPPDPYPFIFLNLILSCVAAIQAPVIMMSQNRQELRDRLRAEQDYKVNLKAELEIRHLHEKVDHLLHHHAQRLLEIQQIQTDMLRQLVSATGASPRTSP
ncbi:MAG: DUF1003 domain-containing protein [Verrucomicrobiales bacterium]|nr:DUF1003 domain-containing protein [Verrucomicrobiales bacterium]MCP5557810.1 DUF1003 domain-containing protein [Verrucomicrobiaceae bacterium]